MARLTFDRAINARYRPGLAPWRSHEIPICETPGTALPAGAVLTIPDDYAYTFHRDWLIAPQWGAVTWLELPSTAELEAQRATAVAAAPHVENPPVSVPLPEVS